MSDQKRAEARQAFDRGIQCILKCQIKVGGKRTAWCAQHDEIDFRPRRARSYELPSLSGAESVGIVPSLLMRPRLPQSRGRAPGRCRGPSPGSKRPSCTEFGRSSSRTQNRPKVGIK